MAEEKKAQDKKKQLEALNEEMAGNSKCCQLADVRTNIVPGEGNADADVLFIGEGPGRNEDEQGRPFVGQAGQLLNQLLAEIGWKREDVFIANVVKCRPPQNRDPLPEEVETCWPWLVKQVEIIEPQLIVLLGRHAMERFLPGMKISAVRGKVLRRNIPGIGMKVLMPTYHPAAALYHGQWLTPLKEDFRKIPRIIEHLKSGSVEGLRSDSDNCDWDSLEIGPKKEEHSQGRLL
ncbi:MAG: uracil-DNA glycosylase [Candidatus Moraniibacteriota bacterium]